MHISSSLSLYIHIYIYLHLYLLMFIAWRMNNNSASLLRLCSIWRSINSTIVLPEAHDLGLQTTSNRCGYPKVSFQEGTPCFEPAKLTSVSLTVAHRWPATCNSHLLQKKYFFFNIAIQYYSNQCQSYSTSHDIGIVAQPSTMDCRASAASAASGDPPFSCHSTTMHHGHELGTCVFGAFKWVPDGTPLQNLKHAYEQIYV